MGEYIQWLRGQVGPALLPIVYATAVVRDALGRILFQRRSDFGAAWWGLPGGLLEPGETPEAGLRREVMEETGLRAEPRRLTGVYSSARYRLTYPNGDAVQQVTFCYECEWLDGVPRPEPGEVEALTFFAPEALPSRPLWYTDMLDHALGGSHQPYFDLPERAHLDTPYPSLRSLQAVVGQGGLVWPTARAAVLDEAGRLLLQRSAVTGDWALPGGALETGETLAHTAMRRTREQTGLEIVPEALLGVLAGDNVVCSNGQYLFPVAALFAGRVSGGLLQACQSAEVAFFDPRRLSVASSSVQLLAQTALAGAARPGPASAL